MNPIAEELAALDRQYSNRYIELDPNGYFIIYVDRSAGMICVKHYSNVINDRGLACDPETGKPIPAKAKNERTPTFTLCARTAKEMCIEIFEKSKPCPVGYLDHAAYLGRELMRAEMALVMGEDYIQD